MSTVAQMVANVQGFAPSLTLARDTILVDLNNALQDLFEEADLEATSGVDNNPTLVTVAGQQSYPLPANCVKPLDLAWRIGGVLSPVTYLQRDEYRLRTQRLDGSSPVAGAVYWNLFGGRIWLWPVPTSNGAIGGDGELILDYYKKPAALVSDSDVPDIPEQYHNLLEMWAVSLAYARSDEGQWAVYWKGLYESGKKQLQMERATTQRAVPAKIKPARGW